MRVSRRSWLVALAAVPFVGKFVAKASDPETFMVTPVAPTQNVSHGPYQVVTPEMLRGSLTLTPFDLDTDGEHALPFYMKYGRKKGIRVEMVGREGRTEGFVDAERARAIAEGFLKLAEVVK